MPTLSFVHQLFSLEQCQAYIHTLWWKDRALQCPRCQSQDVDPWGKYHYRPGGQRSWCQGCKRTFNDLTHTLLHRSKRSLAYWILATFLLCLSCSSRRIARELGVHVRTSYRWCWWLRNAAVSYEMHRQREGTVEADDLYQGYVVGSRAGAVAVGPGSSCWPAAFALCRCLSPSRHSVSSSRLIARSMRISRTTRTYLLRLKGYGTSRTGSAFNRSCVGRETR
jgi:transposase-like protein